MSFIQNLMTTSIRRTFESNEQFRGYVNKITVSDTKIEFGEDQNGPVVVVIGKAKNTSPVDWKEVLFHVDFFNSNGELIDTGQQESYTWRLPAGEETAFKVSFQRQLPEKEYANYKVRVISAVDAKKRF